MHETPTPHSDCTFITNEKGQTLNERFRALIKDTASFDVLVGYFYLSGFHLIYPPLRGSEHIRILIGIGTDSSTYRAIEKARQQALPLSHARVKDHCRACVIEETDTHEEDTKEVEDGIRVFRDWLKSKKLAIRAYPTRDIHAKLYIMTFKKGDKDKGRVITGSSNFTKAGLQDNLEFNVELKTAADYEFAHSKFEELWEEAVDVSEQYAQTIERDTWLRDDITPYELYLKFLYSYFEDELSLTDEEIDVPFRKLEYQQEAVSSAKRMIETYGGVFLSDVVGLGKTYMAALLAKRIGGRHLAILPPRLFYETSPGSWESVFQKLRVPILRRPSSKLDEVLDGILRGSIDYDNVFVDEAHAFRNPDSESYHKLTKICRGKRVILVTATPFNNRPRDILSQIELFQNAQHSNVPNLSNLGGFFTQLESKVPKRDQQKNREEYMRVVKKNAKRIREEVLKHLMVRRTRSEVQTYFKKDLESQGITFPEVEAPRSVYYILNEEEGAAFDRTVALIQKLKYARYAPMLYYKGDLKNINQYEQGQKNLKGFIKTLLVKRLESSFHAFKKTLERFIGQYEGFIKAYDRGEVYFSKYMNKILEHLDDDDDKVIQELMDKGKAEVYPASDFSDDLRADLQSDLRKLEKMKEAWDNIVHDPKLEKFKEHLTVDPRLRGRKVVTFTESRETAEYLERELREQFPGEILLITSASGKRKRAAVVENFDADAKDAVVENFDDNAQKHAENYRILIATEVLSEGVNLHQSNVVVNYDLPWNPTRIMQRVGRVNRIGTKFDKIHSFNFFPTRQANDEIKLKEIAQAKIAQFIELLGEDARHLTADETIESHGLFDRLTSKQVAEGEEGEEESELKYRAEIKEVRENDPKLFEKIKRLPKKARVAKKHPDGAHYLLTYFQKGQVKKFFLAEGEGAKEVDFMQAAKLLKAPVDEPRERMPDDFWDRLEDNKKAFEQETDLGKVTEGLRSTSEKRLLKSLRAMLHTRTYTEKQTDYIEKVKDCLQKGRLPKYVVTKANSALKAASDPKERYACLKNHISESLMKPYRHEKDADTEASERRAVILSEYLVR